MLKHRLTLTPPGEPPTSDCHCPKLLRPSMCRVWLVWYLPLSKEQQLPFSTPSCPLPPSEGAPLPSWVGSHWKIRATVYSIYQWKVIHYSWTMMHITNPWSIDNTSSLKYHNSTNNCKINKNKNIATVYQNSQAWLTSVKLLYCPQNLLYFSGTMIQIWNINNNINNTTTATVITGKIMITKGWLCPSPGPCLG